MNKDKKAWTEVHAVVVLFVRNEPGKEPELLLGPKTNGTVRGMIMPPGGHVEDSDIDHISAGHREGFEECGLVAVSSRKVAELRIRVLDKHRKVIVHANLCTRWTGQLQNKGSEFKWLRFIPYSEIPWDKLPPGEDAWLRRILFQKKKSLVRITCKKNRRDLVKITTCAMQ